MEDKSILYRDNDFIIRKSKEEDIDYLSNNLRDSDIQEIWDSHNKKPRESLEICLESAVLSLTAEYRNKPVFIFGLYTESLIGTKAVVWMLATDDINMLKMKYIKIGKNFINFMLSLYPCIYNYVSLENKKAIKFLRFLGANFSPPCKYGVERKLFQYFYFER